MKATRPQRFYNTFISGLAGAEGAGTIFAQHIVKPEFPPSALFVLPRSSLYIPVVEPIRAERGGIEQKKERKKCRRELDVSSQ